MHTLSKHKPKNKSNSRTTENLKILYRKLIEENRVKIKDGDGRLMEEVVYGPSRTLPAHSYKGQRRLSENSALMRSGSFPEDDAPP